MDLITVPELAEKAGVSPSYIARLCRTGEIPAVRKGGIWLIRKKDAQQYLDSREAKEDTAAFDSSAE